MVQPQGNDPGCQDPDLVTGEGQGIIEKTQLQDERCVLDGFHINPVDGMGQPFAADPHQPQQDSQHRGNQDASNGAFHGNGKPLYEICFVSQHNGPGLF